MREVQSLACVADVEREMGRGRGNLDARERVGRAREKGKERLQGRYCFLHFLRSDSPPPSRAISRPNSLPLPFRTPATHAMQSLTGNTREVKFNCYVT